MDFDRDLIRQRNEDLHREIQALRPDNWPPGMGDRGHVGSLLGPDGARIAFTSEGTEEVGEIFVMNSDGSGLTKLTDDPADDSFPACRLSDRQRRSSPARKYLIYVMRRTRL